MQVRGVVTFKLITRSSLVERVKRVANVFEAVAKHQVMRRFEHLRLPRMFEFFEAFEHWEEAEIHRSHVEAGNLRLQRFGGFDTIFNGHIG